VTKLFGDFVEASLATVLDADGKEAGRQVLMDGETLPKAPKGGKVKARAGLAHLPQRGLRLPHHHRRAAPARPSRQAHPGEKGKGKGKPQPDSSLRDTENVPLAEDVETYFKREVLPHAPDAWIDHEKTKVGYEIPFNRHFYVFEPPRELAEIDTDLKKVTDRIKAMIEGLSGSRSTRHARTRHELGGPAVEAARTPPHRKDGSP
jgi:type I restriction enzyme M protein